MFGGMWRQKCLGTELARITSEPLLFSKAQATPKQTWQFVLDMEHLAINSILQRGSSLKQAKNFNPFHGALSGEDVRHGH